MNNAKDFLNKLCKDEDFLNNCLIKLQKNPTEISDYIISQGYKFEASELQNSIYEMQNESISIWSGVYKFTTPNTFAEKLLKISSKNDLNVSIENENYIVSPKGNKTFELRKDTTIISITFTENLRNDGTIGENTFQGTITVSGFVQNTQGEQVLYREEKAWQNASHFLTMGIVSILIGFLTIIISIVSAMKKCANPETREVVLEDLQDITSTFKEYLRKDARERFREILLESVEDTKKDVLEDLKKKYKKLFENMLNDQAYSAMEEIEKLERIEQDLNDRRMNEELSKIINKKVNVELGVDYESIVRSEYEAIDSTTNFINEMIQKKAEMIEFAVEDATRKVEATLRGSKYGEFCIGELVNKEKSNVLKRSIPELVREIDITKERIQNMNQREQSISGEIARLERDFNEELIVKRRDDLKSQIEDKKKDLDEINKRIENDRIDLENKETRTGEICRIQDKFENLEKENTREKKSTEASIRFKK